MTEYLFHWLPAGTERLLVPDVRLTADSRLHGAALALRHFKEVGCDLSMPFAHVDITEPDGARHTLLVEEVLDWLSDPKQAAFVRCEGLDTPLGIPFREV
jgi:hypothetical protein